MDRTVLLFGNDSPMMQMMGAINGFSTRARATHLEQSVTRVELRPGYDDSDFNDLSLSTDNDRFLLVVANALADQHHHFAVAINELEQIIDRHANGLKPAWVECEQDPLFAEAVSKYFGDIPIGQPVALQTNVGRDHLHQQYLSTSPPATFTYGALSANSGGGFASTDTTLAGEITTASGGLIRKAMTFAHTTGTNSSTLTATYTANANDVLPVTLSSGAIFDAASAGNMAQEDALSVAINITTIGDSAAITFTWNAG